MALAARDVMKEKIVTAEPTLSAADLERLLNQERISGAPVVEQGRLVGVVSRADIVRAVADAEDGADVVLDYYRDIAGATPTKSEHARLAGERAESLRVSDLMSRQLVSVAPTATLREVAAALTEHGIHRVLVAEGSRLLGVISTLDLVRLLADGRLVEGSARGR